MTSGPNEGEVTIQIKTVASGVDSTSDSRQFQFNIVPVLDGFEGEGREFVRKYYVSGTFETVTITNLEPGQIYTFIATAENSFGASETANSRFVTAGAAYHLSICSKVVIHYNLLFNYWCSTPHSTTKHRCHYLEILYFPLSPSTLSFFLHSQQHH